LLPRPAALLLASRAAGRSVKVRSPDFRQKKFGF